MKRTRDIKFWVAAALLAGGFVWTAQANLCELQISYDTAYTGTIHDGAGNAGNGKTCYLTAFSAALLPGATGHPSDPLPPNHSNPFTTFCIDIRWVITDPAYWQSGSFPINEGDTSTHPLWVTDGIYRAASLYQHYASQAGIMGGSAQKYGAALQLALWEVLYEPFDGNINDYSVTSGSGFYVTGADSGVTTLANSMLHDASADVANHNLTTTFWNAVTAADGTTPLTENQDLIGPISQVPEPSTCIASGLLLLPFLASMLRRRA